MMTVKDKIVLVTGASAGIGQACAEVFAEAGAKLILMARRQEKVEALAAKLKETHGVEVYTFTADVRNYNEMKEKVEALPKEWKDIDVLINNAGLARGLSKLHEGDLHDWEEMIDTNVKGLLYVSRLVIPQMAERKSGHIINIASIAGRQVYPNGNVYCATKHAAKALSEAMMIDLNGTDVRVSNIDPGLVDTEFSTVRFHGDKEKAESVYNGMTPLYGQDIAEIALFCAMRPKHVTIQDVLVTPTDQAAATIVYRR